MRDSYTERGVGGGPFEHGCQYSLAGTETQAILPSPETADESFLEDTDTVYPVNYNPFRTFSYENVKDTYICSGLPTWDYHDNPFIKVGNVGGSEGIARGIIYFNYLNDHIKGSTVKQAHVYALETSGQPFTGNIDVTRLTSGYNDNVTWNEHPSYEVGKVYANAQQNGSEYFWNITDLCKKWAEQTDTNYGIMLNSNPENGAGSFYRTFSSSESGSTQSMRLVVTYEDETAPGTPESFKVTRGYSKSNRNVQVGWTGVLDNPQGGYNTGIKQYQLGLNNGSGYSGVAYVTSTATASDPTPGYSYVFSNLTEGQRYRFAIRVQVNAGNWSGWKNWAIIWCRTR
jgi:hypothetical protein